MHSYERLLVIHLLGPMDSCSQECTVLNIAIEVATFLGLLVTCELIEMLHGVEVGIGQCHIVLDGVVLPEN